MCDNASMVLDQSHPIQADPTSPDFPVVFSQLRSAVEAAESKALKQSRSRSCSDLRLTVASEVLDHLAAVSVDILSILCKT